MKISKLCLDKEDMPEMTEEELDKINKQEMEYQITMLEERLKQMSPNMAAIEEYRKKVSTTTPHISVYVYYNSDTINRNNQNNSKYGISLLNNTGRSTSGSYQRARLHYL